MIAPAVANIKQTCETMVSTKINEAIQTALDLIVEDLSDDVLPYLSEEDMAAMRAELIEKAKAYGQKKLDA